MYSICILALSAASGPHVSSTKASAMSIPAEMPEEVRNLPSTTQRASLTQFTRFPVLTTQSKDKSLEVARRPSSTPAAAKRADPVHTVITRGDWAARLANCPIHRSFPNQSSRAGPARYQQNSLGVDLFGSYSIDPDTAFPDFHSRAVQGEKPRPGAIRIDENLKRAKDIQGFKPIEYDNIDIQAYQNDPLLNLRR